MKVSIIVIVYNTEKYLKSCLDSLINQTYENIEIIVVDDGSTDNSLEIINRYEIKDKRIKKITQTNKGCVMARTNGAKIATGEYSMFIDSDDWIEENTVEELVKKIQQTNVDIIKFRAINEPSKKVQDNILNEKDFIFEECKKDKLYEMLITTTKLNNVWNEIIKTELFNTNNPFLKENINQGDDFLINLDVFYNAKRILLTDSVYYHYFHNINSVTKTQNLSKRMKNIIDLIYIYNVKEEYLKKFGLSDNKKLTKQVELRNLDVISNQIGKILQCKNLSKNDLLKLQASFVEEGFYNTIKNINTKDIKDKNLVKRFIKLNIIKKNIERAYKYRYIVNLYAKLKNIN